MLSLTDREGAPPTRPTANGDVLPTLQPAALIHRPSGFSTRFDRTEVVDHDFRILGQNLLGLPLLPPQPPDVSAYHCPPARHGELDPPRALCAPRAKVPVRLCSCRTIVPARRAWEVIVRWGRSANSHSCGASQRSRY